MIVKQEDVILTTEEMNERYLKSMDETKLFIRSFKNLMNAFDQIKKEHGEEVARRVTERFFTEANRTI